MKLKILFLTDSHIRGNNPCNRKDDYSDALRKKHIEIGQIIKDQNVDIVLHGGDVFHSPDTSKSIISEYIKIFKSWKVFIGVILGSHDAIAYNEHTVSRTALGVLIAADVIKLLGSIPTEVCPGVFAVGINHSYKLDEHVENYFLEKEDKDSILIEVAHGMIVDKPFFDEYTLLKDIKTEADLMLCGHFHVGWEPKKENGTLFINPGSIGRIENSERAFPPSVVIITIENSIINYKIVPLKSAAPAEVIFKNTVRLDSNTSEKILEFMNKLSERTGTLEKQDVKSLILNLAREENLSSEIIDAALLMIEEVKNME